MNNFSLSQVNTDHLESLSTQEMRLCQKTKPSFCTAKQKVIQSRKLNGTKMASKWYPMENHIELYYQPDRYSFYMLFIQKRNKMMACTDVWLETQLALRKVGMLLYKWQVSEALLK